MSCEIFTPGFLASAISKHETRIALENMVKTRVRDVLVFFDGAFPPVGRLMDVSAKVELVNLKDKYALSHDSTLFRSLKVIYVKGHYQRNGAHIEQALDIARRFFDPRGLFLIVGNSAGGVDALEFCRRFEMKPHFEFSSDMLAPERHDEENKETLLGSLVEAPNSKVTLPAEIDGLWIHNGGFSVSTGLRSREVVVPLVVKSHVNYYMEAFNPESDDSAAALVTEFHDRTRWKRVDGIVGLNVVNYNIECPPPLGTEGMNAPWSSTKLAAQQKNHTELIVNQLEPVTLAEIEGVLQRRVDLSPFKQLLKGLMIQSSAPEFTRLRVMAQRFRAH